MQRDLNVNANVIRDLSLNADLIRDRSVNANVRVCSCLGLLCIDLFLHDV